MSRLLIAVALLVSAGAVRGEPITREDLEARHRELRASARSQREGVFGPRSMVWRLLRENAMYFGAGAAVMIQLADPTVSLVLERNSVEMTERPVHRYESTVKFMYKMMFGDLETQLAMSRKLFELHSSVKPATDADGKVHSALEPTAVMWVHASLWHSAIKSHELMFGKLTARERKQLYEEIKQAGRLMGLSTEHMPATMEDFEKYVETESQRLVDRVPEFAKGRVKKIFATVEQKINQSRVPGGHWLLRSYLRLSAELVPRPIAEAYGLRRRGMSQFALLLPSVRAVYSQLPDSARYVVEYREARERLGQAPTSFLRRLCRFAELAY